ncbi:MAG: ELWxxDGT repeat protein [Anaerolineae bacterium]
MSRARRVVCLTVALLLSVVVPLQGAQAGGGPFHLFRDINTSSHAAGGIITDMVGSGGTLYLAVMEDAYGWGGLGELWRSDGVPASGGTALVRDIRPGPYDSIVYGLTAIGSTIYFSADDGSRGRELWKSDGSPSGTELVSDIRPGPLASEPYGFVAVGGTLFFTADDGTHGRELWKSDGTAAGTVMVRDIHPGATGSLPTELVAFKGGVAFAATDPDKGTELWYSDGSEAGTVRIADIAADGASAEPRELVTMYTGGERLFFAATDCGATICNGRELWTSDGTVAGTTMVFDIDAGAADSAPDELYVLDGGLYFAAGDGTTGREPWYSDGTDTHLIADIGWNTHGSSPHGFASLGGTVYFVADDLDDITSIHGAELWRTRGDAASTALVADVQPGPVGSYPQELTAFSGALYFSADFGYGIGRQLWRTDGTTTAMISLDGPTASPGGAQPRNLTVFTAASGDAKLYFGANDAQGGSLWQTDGTLEGTVAVQAIRPNSMDSWVWGSHVVGDKLYFAADNYYNSAELWASDGTVVGTTLIKDIYPLSSGYGAYFSYPRGFVDFGGAAYFAAADGAHGRELWRSDGTAAGTVLVSDIAPGSVDGNPWSLTVYDDRLYFGAYSAPNDSELWSSDGQPGGVTELAVNVAPVGSSNPDSLAVFDGMLYFSATGDAVGRELWRSDGTPGGTTAIDIVPGANGSGPASLTVSGGTLYFTASDGTHGVELWRSDGTLAGTSQVSDILPGADGSSPVSLTDVDGVLYFVANDGVHGMELWRSDGTSAGTTLVRDIYPGPIGSMPLYTSVAAMNGYVVFAASDGGQEYDLGSNGHGCEPWMSDGTQYGTRMLQDIITGPRGSNPESFVVFGDMLYLSADDGINGQELWAGMPFRMHLPEVRRGPTPG